MYNEEQHERFLKDYEAFKQRALEVYTALASNGLLRNVSIETANNTKPELLEVDTEYSNEFYILVSLGGTEDDRFIDVSYLFMDDEDVVRTEAKKMMVEQMKREELLKNTLPIFEKMDLQKYKYLKEKYGDRLNF